MKPIDNEIDRVLMELSKMKPDSEEYSNTVKNLQILYLARTHKESPAVSADTILSIVANIGGLLLVLNYEQLHVISSRAFGWILKLRN